VTRDNKSSTSQPLHLVTGANTGIGFEVARALAKSNAHVVLACRSREKGQTAVDAIAREIPNAQLELLHIDLGSQESIRIAASEFLRKHDTLDVLINNASVALHRRETSVDGIELTFATNVLGYFVLTNLLLDALKRAQAGRIVNVSSKLAGNLDLGDVDFKRRKYDGTTAYAQSKQAERMLTWTWARRLAETRVTANALSPGMVNTRMLRSFNPAMRGKTPEQGADTIVWLATSAEVAGKTDKFWADRKEERCPFHDRDQEEALWALCESMTQQTKTQAT
jgi:retinol dehydrogenase 12